MELDPWANDRIKDYARLRDQLLEYLLGEVHRNSLARVQARPRAASQRSASMAAMHPEPAAVTACR